MPSEVHWGKIPVNQPGVPAAPDLLCLGDSWFWYPASNLMVELAQQLDGHVLLGLGYNGAEASEWRSKYRKEVDYAFELDARRARALFLSGGGNDVAGVYNFSKIVNPDCSAATGVDGCYRPGEPEATLRKLAGFYGEIIAKFRGYNKTAPVVLHNYDYAWPSGEGLFGPAKWLKYPMTKAKVPDGVSRDLFRDIIDRFGHTMRTLAQDPALGPVVFVQTAGTLPEDEQSYWANELHPTPEGFAILVEQAFMPALKQASIA